MKKYLIFSFLLWCHFYGFTQDRPVKVLFDVSSKDGAVHSAAVRHVKMMANAYRSSQFEIVVYGAALPMVLSNESTVSEEILELAKHQNVTINVCGESLIRNKKDRSELLAGVQVVPDGILELVTRQSEGWGYIKEVN